MIPLVPALDEFGWHHASCRHSLLGNAARLERCSHSPSGRAKGAPWASAATRSPSVSPPDAMVLQA
jgi:hypothetical protein